MLHFLIPDIVVFLGPVGITVPGFHDFEGSFHGRGTEEYVPNGDKDAAIDALQQFANEEDDYFFWIVIFLRHDPILQSLSDHPKYEAIMSQLDQQFWSGHEQLKNDLKDFYVEE